MSEPRALPRMPLVDAARGAGILLMVVYHGAWDLSWFHYLQTDVGSHPGWKLFAWLTAGLFLLLVGVSLTLAVSGGLQRRRWLWRLGRVVGAAALVSLASRWLFADGWIFFGILHHIALASVLGLAFVRLPPPATLMLAVLVLAAPWLARLPLFDHPLLQWVGLGTFVPSSYDYVPLFPWFAPVLAGIALGHGLVHRPRLHAVASAPREGRAWRWLRWAGRHSLIIYLLHQPLLYGTVAALDRVWPASRLASESTLMQRCVRGCQDLGNSVAVCEVRCTCAEQRLAPPDLWRPLMAGTLPASEHERVRRIIATCP